MFSSNLKILIAAIICIIMGIAGSVTVYSTSYKITTKIEITQNKAENFIDYELKPLRGNIYD